MTFKFNGWPRKTMGHLFYAMSNFVHYFKAISEFKLELQPGNAQFGSKSMIFLSCVNLKFDGWHWKTIGHLFYATSSLLYHFIAIGQFKLGLQTGNTQFGSKSTIFVPWEIQTGVTVRKHPIRINIDDFLPRTTLKFDGWPWKTIWHLFYATLSFVCHFIAVCEIKLESQSGNARFESKSAICRPVWPWNLMDDLGKQ